MPGESTVLIEALPDCYRYYPSHYYKETYEILCSFKDGIFSLASIGVSSDKLTIRTAYFAVRPGKMQAGDLTRWFDGVTLSQAAPGSWRTFRILSWEHGHAWSYRPRRFFFFGASAYVYSVWFDSQPVYSTNQEEN